MLVPVPHTTSYTVPAVKPDDIASEYDVPVADATAFTSPLALALLTSSASLPHDVDPDTTTKHFTLSLNFDVMPIVKPLLDTDDIDGADVKPPVDVSLQIY